MTITAVRPVAAVGGNTPAAPAPGIDFDELVREQRFEMLVRDHQRRITCIIYSLCGDWADAEEAVQDAILDLWVDRQRLDIVRDPAAWLVNAAKWKLRQVRATRAKQCPALLGEHIERVEEQQHEPSAGACLGDPEIMKQVQRALATLSPGMRQVVELHCLDGLPIDEVASRTGKTRHAVSQLLYLALRQHTDWFGPEWRERYASDPEAEVLRTRVSVLAKLTPRVREAAWLRYVDGLSIDEVATRMRISRKSATDFVWKARSAARAELAKVQAQ